MATDSEAVRIYLRALAANVRSARIEAKLTQEQLAERAGIDMKFLQRIEAARTNASVATVVRLAVALEVEPGALLAPAFLTPPPPGRPLKRQ